MNTSPIIYSSILLRCTAARIMTLVLPSLVGKQFKIQNGTYEVITHNTLGGPGLAVYFQIISIAAAIITDRPHIEFDALQHFEED